MGQKTHPIGLRVGLWQRKWNNTWFTSENSYSKLFFSHQNVNSMLSNFFYSYKLTKKMFTNRALLINSKFIKANITFGFLFIFFYKLRPKRIRRVSKLIKKLKKIKGKKKENKKNLNIN